MKFTIEIEGNTQPELMHSLDEARNHLIQGGCYLNVCGCTNVVMRPSDNESEEEFRRQYWEAHPRPAIAWAK